MSAVVIVVAAMVVSARPEIAANYRRSDLSTTCLHQGKITCVTINYTVCESRDFSRRCERNEGAQASSIEFRV